MSHDPTNFKETLAHIVFGKNRRFDVLLGFAFISFRQLLIHGGQ
jgi:hypothetical protein